MHVLSVSSLIIDVWTMNNCVELRKGTLMLLVVARHESISTSIVEIHAIHLIQILKLINQTSKKTNQQAVLTNTYQN